jgi:hypothetical protein
MQVAGIVVAGVGVLGLGASAYFGLRASSLDADSRSDGHCANNDCDPYGFAKRSDAGDAANLATAFLVAGAGAAAAGTTLFLLGRGSDAPVRVDASALAGPGLLGVRMQGRF